MGLNIGKIRSLYIAEQKVGKEYVRFYDLPSEDNTHGESHIYNPLKDKVLVEGKPSLILVDEGAEFFLAVIENEKDGVALAYNHRCVSTQT